ncbi:MAG TPA: SH3-like domain-containing protein [Candidatus Aquilonibacter sp.]|nr:SH3-like domain-containing protein [Candidatus Aquilonibacter sp.]
MFDIGSRVRTKTRHSGHTRLPHYLENKSGVITAMLGRYPLPDAVVRDGARAVESTLYTVAFRAPELFPDGSSDVVYADLFAAYLEADA